MDRDKAYATADELFGAAERAAIEGFYASYEPAQAKFEYRALADQVGTVRNIFYGDSITQVWPLHEFFPGVSILNRGIGGDNAVGLHLRLEADVLRYRPERVFMMVGINGIGWPEDLTVARITYVAHEMLERGIRVWLGSICPLRFPDKWNRFQYQDRIVRVNARLAEWAAAHGCGFLDYHAALRDGDGQLRAEFARPDGTHLLLPAYVVMSRLVAPHLAR